jgi:hypothetical protein
VNYPELHRRLYHGSVEAVRDIDLSASAPKKDFGRGFYTTNDNYQAEKFARLKASRSCTSKGCVSVFDFQNAEGLKIKKFTASDRE